jgi:hypothetical protein
MGSNRLRCRAFREGDEKAILRVVNETSIVECSLDEWAWLLPPEEDGRLIVVGEADNEIVAVCAGAPVRVTIDGRQRSGVNLRWLAARDRIHAARVFNHFVEVFGSNGRFDLAMAHFDFEGAAAISVRELVREKSAGGAPRRFLYRAELARDWEPRLDGLWSRVRDSYPVAVVRDADFALRRFAGHPTIRHHRFLVFPRYSQRPVAFAVFAHRGSQCCWLDLLWDHRSPGALDLLAHISGQLAAQWRSSAEHLWLAGDDAASHLLARRGFQPLASSQPAVSVRSFNPDVADKDMMARAYLTAADLGGLGT